MLEYIKFLDEYVNAPAKLIAGIVMCILCMQVIGELLELCGKAAPGVMKLRKNMAAKKQAENELRELLKEATAALKADQQLFEKINRNYDADNIAKRDVWMHRVDDGIAANKGDIQSLKEQLMEIYDISMKDHVEALRSIIIGFANRISDKNAVLTHEEFRRAITAHEEYEEFLEKHNLKNGQVDIAFRVITEDYAERLRNREFLEDIRGYHQEL